MSRLTTSQERLIKATLTAKPYPLTSPCFGFAKTSLSLQKANLVAYFFEIKRERTPSLGTARRKVLSK
jgi:hypothetical protein